MILKNYYELTKLTIEPKLFWRILIQLSHQSFNAFNDAAFVGFFGK
jgi:hypothetical protein